MTDQPWASNQGPIAELWRTKGSRWPTGLDSQNVQFGARCAMSLWVGRSLIAGGAAMILAMGSHDARGPERRKSCEKFLLAECRNWSEAFVDEVGCGGKMPP